jgi:hypothetical protein
VALRRTVRTLALLAAAAALAAPETAHAQRVDSTRAGVSQPRSRRRAPRTPADSAPRPPISPKQAFLSSFLVPGLGQARLDRPNAGALFVAVEFTAIAMARKSAADLHYAERFSHDSIIVGYTLDAQGAPTDTIYARNRYSGDRVKARRVHLEDWLAVLFFNHLISGADAFVAAQLWDLPGQVSFRAAPRGAAVSASVPW